MTQNTSAFSTFLRALNLFARVLIVTFCFIIDIKVRADIKLVSVNGRAETEHAGVVKTLQIKTGESVTESSPADVETFAQGRLQFESGENKFSVAENSLLTYVNDQEFDLVKGTIYVQVPFHAARELKIRTQEGDLVSNGGEFIISIESGKTKVTALDGKIAFRDRAEGTDSLALSGGYAGWMGGLLTSGRHAAGSGACDFENTISILKSISRFEGVELLKRTDKLKTLWHDAVMKIAEATQNATNEDIAVLNQIVREERRREEAKDREEASVRRLFREKTLGVPGQNTEDPSASTRVPASADE